MLRKEIVSATVGVLLLGTHAKEEVLSILHNAKIFTMEPNQNSPIDGYLTISNSGKILEVNTGDPDWDKYNASEVRDLKGFWLLPGFVSAHSHLWQSAFRGIAGDSTLTDWINGIYNRELARASDEDAYWFTLHGSLDHIRNGITTAYNFNSGYPGSRRSLNEFKGECDSGLRFVHGISINGQSSLNQIQEQTKDFIEWGYQQNHSELLSFAVNVNGIFSNTSHQIEFESQTMQSFDLMGQIHYVEEADTAIEQQRKFQWIQKTNLLPIRQYSVILYTLLQRF